MTTREQGSVGVVARRVLRFPPAFRWLPNPVRCIRRRWRCWRDHAIWPRLWCPLHTAADRWRILTGPEASRGGRPHSFAAAESLPRGASYSWPPRDSAIADSEPRRGAAAIVALTGTAPHSAAQAAAARRLHAKTPRHVEAGDKQRMHGRPASRQSPPTAQSSSSPKRGGESSPNPPLTRVSPKALPGSEATTPRLRTLTAAAFTRSPLPSG